MVNRELGLDDILWSIISIRFLSVFVDCLKQSYVVLETRV